jgi:hypothetical protein
MKKKIATDDADGTDYADHQIIDPFPIRVIRLIRVIRGNHLSGVFSEE